jgi:hypothetical protein
VSKLARLQPGEVRAAIESLLNGGVRYRSAVPVASVLLRRRDVEDRDRAFNLE